MRPDVAPLLLTALCVLHACACSRVEEMKSQERLFLSSLGLSGRPRPAGGHQPRRHVPSALWRMFRRSGHMQAQESEPCTVSEYGVRGNIIRYVQDQGRQSSCSLHGADSTFPQLKLENKVRNQICFIKLLRCSFSNLHNFKH